MDMTATSLGPCSILNKSVHYGLWRIPSLTQTLCTTENLYTVDTDHLVGCGPAWVKYTLWSTSGPFVYSQIGPEHR